MRNEPLPFLNHDPQQAGPQYLEDLATGYWFSEVLFTAVEAKVFTLLEPEGRSLEELSRLLDLAPEGLERFLGALCSLGLTVRSGPHYFNSGVASEYLVIGKELYQGDSILWRKELVSCWEGLKQCMRAGGRDVRNSIEDEGKRADRIRRYVNAMDCIARTKVKEILSLFEGLRFEGKLLDVGAGSGAIAAGFLDYMPSLEATLMDIPEVIDYTKDLMMKRGLSGRSSFMAANILEKWPEDRSIYDIVILSNIIHAYSAKELYHILASASQRVKEDGFLIIHDFFLDHHPRKAALFDLNMFINTYNGRVFPSRKVREELKGLELYATGLIPLSTDTALIVASKREEKLSELCIDPKTRLLSRLMELGFVGAAPITIGSIRIADWADSRCRYGCDHYGNAHCPPYSPSPEKTRRFLDDYSHAVLLEGEPPTRKFQLRVLEAEKEAFKAGFYKAFAYWAGPCSLCSSCTTDGTCRNTRDARPSMEGAGIDVFETVRLAGRGLRTLNRRDDFVKYYGLLLLE